ncbi:hypothetical protein AtubIFM57258_009560 [Aspergillus tubingensis]|nr:hypothetical protein AtubIFM57258_009560 [Aspergillus tubingensis]
MPTSSLLWSVGSLALSSMILPAAASGYQLVETWKGEDFLTAFDFYTGADPTNGFVTYANQSYAESKGLVKVNSNGTFYMGVDHTTKLSTNGPGRESVRIGSNKYYDEGLFIIDLEHMPGSVCGTWPAFWSTGKDWPTDGEIDIIEGVNKNEANEIVLHTSGTCQVSSQKMTGTLSSTECGEDSGTTGCVVEGTQGSSGTPFNENGGGVYAMQWTDEFLKFWFFPRGSIPTSITKGDPDVAAFGTPMAHMQGSCSIAEHFKAQQFIFDTTFCGDWAGGVYSTSGCPVSDSSSSFKSCVAYVAENPAAFAESYWEINYIKIYQTGVAASASASASRVESAATVVETVSSVKEVTNSVVGTTAAATTVAATADAATTITMAETTTAAAATESSVADENGSSASTSTHYVTMTTTICPIAESSSAAAALAGGSSEATEGSNSEGSSATTTPASASGASAEANGSEGSSAAATTPSTATGASAEANGSESSSASDAGGVASGTPSDISTTGASAEANGSEDSSASSEAKAVASATLSSVTGVSAEANGSDSASSNAATTSNVSGASTQSGDDESTPASAVANAGSSATPASVSGASAEANGSEQSAAAAASSVSGASAVANGSEGSSSQSSGSQAGSDSYGSVPSSAAAYGRPAPSSSSHAFATVPSSSGSIRKPTSAAAANNAAAATQGSSASGSKSGHSGSGSSSATTPSTPVFTGGANKLTLGASSVVGVLAFALLA